MTNEERDELINSILPDTVKGQQRPAENLNPDMPYNTDFPQLINKDPASADVFNLINRQLLSNDKTLNDNKADKTYVDKKVADLVNGAPEQLDTLQELSKALNNDKDYAATVNNALAEKLGRTEKAVSAETADSANTLEGVPLSHGGDNTFGKIPIIGDDGVLEIGKYIDFHSKKGDKKDYSTRIEANDDGTISISGGVNANLNGNASSADTLTGFIRADNIGNDWGNQIGELVANFFPGAKGGTIAFRVDNPIKSEVSMLIDGVVYQREGVYKCIDENSINDYLKNYLPLSGGAMTGVIHKSTNDTALYLYGGTGWDEGAELALYGKNWTPPSGNNDAFQGGFRLTAMDGTKRHYFRGSADGMLKWGNTDIAGAGIVSQQLGQDMSYIKYENGLLVQFGMMEVQGYSGTKMYVKTLPISFKATYSLQATLGYPNTDRVSSVQAETDLTYIKLYVHNFINDHNAPVYYCHWLMIGSWK